jgi:hypothetical protein
MRVYHFLNEEYGLKVLREKRLKISRIMQLNDPFEFLSVALSDKDFRERLNSSKKKLDKLLGLICFSKSWKSPVQWAHYADRHRGICLGFEIQEHNLHEVRYLDERIVHNGKSGELIVKDLLTCKYSHWSYEQEVRTFEHLEKIDGDIYYKDFSEQVALKEIIVGANSKVSKTAICDILSNYKDEVAYFKARPAFKTFEIVENKNQSAWA